MKITIDTKEDSHEEIRNIIKMLSSMVGEKEVMSNEGDMFSDESPDQSTGIFNMFGSSDSTESKPEDENQEEIEIEPREEKKEDSTELDLPELEEYD